VSRIKNETAAFRWASAAVAASDRQASWTAWRRRRLIDVTSHIEPRRTRHYIVQPPTLLWRRALLLQGQTCLPAYAHHRQRKIERIQSLQIRSASYVRCINEGLNFRASHTLIHKRYHWAIHVEMSACKLLSSHSFGALRPMLISCPTEDRRLSWPEWLVILYPCTHSPIFQLNGHIK